MRRHPFVLTHGSDVKNHKKMFAQQKLLDNPAALTQSRSHAKGL